MNHDARFSELLAEAVREPGIISRAYTLFHNYSLGNGIAAWCTCAAREIPPGPIATYNRWKELGRYVKRGEKAISLCMPITCKRERENAQGQREEVAFNRFIWRPNWFVLAQTEGRDMEPQPVPGVWSPDRALVALDVARVPFESWNGNAQGYAIARTLAVSPIAENPTKTFIHELAHVLLHTGQGDTFQDTQELARGPMEVEAEGVAYLVCSVLELPGLECSRGYIQHWLDGSEVNEKSAARIFATANKVLVAGREPTS
jgi:antirestriction protein ArdC